MAEELDDEEQLVRRHRKEKKELQGDGRGAGNLKVVHAQCWERALCSREPGAVTHLDLLALPSANF